MARPGLSFPGLSGCRWLRRGLWATSLPLIALACATPRESSTQPRLPGLPTFSAPSPALSGIVPVVYHSAAGPTLAPAPVVAGQSIPIDLDTVLRLAEEQNPRIMRAREQVHEAELEHKASRPAGQAKQWQQKIELSKVTQEVLLDAASTYIDLLTARRAEAITGEMETAAQALLKRAEDLMKNDRSASVLYEAVQTEVTGREAAIAKLKQQGSAAVAKLAYLLGFPCDVCLAPVDPTMVPVDLVDVTPPCAALVAQALATGPGVQELQGQIAAIEAGMGQLARWDICGFVQRQLCVTQSKLLQTQLASQELARKLTTGVVEAREAILSGRQQMALGSEQVRHAKEVYRLNDQRLKMNAPGASISEVQQAIRALEQSHSSDLSAISAHNKAQIRLLLLLGQGNGRKTPHKVVEHHP
jgi:outer membrane protein TolC